MAITNFMNLDLPTPTVTLGPEWASDLNAALEVIDAHDHSDGKGVKVKVAGLDINANLSFSGFKAFNLFSTQFSSVVTPLTGASNANSVSVSGGNLYYTNSSGVSIQLTNGSSIVSAPSDVQSYETTSINGDLTISTSDNFVYIIVDSTSSRTITLPLASGVSAGRIYIIKDSSGLSKTNPIFLAASGSDLIDGASGQTLDSNYGSWTVVGDGATNWYLS